jgi:hypothetical protein
VFLNPALGALAAVLAAEHPRFGCYRGAMSFAMKMMQKSQLRRQRELGRGKYQAKQFAGEVVITAIGEAPTPNYKVWLANGSERIFPPIVELWWMKPLGIQPQVLTPFSVHLTFDVGGVPISTIQVRDADGIHEIPVEQAGPAGKPAEPPHAPQRVPANSFRMMLGETFVGYAMTSLIGVPIFVFGEQQFMGDDLHVVDTPMGQQVTVILRQIPDLEVVTFTLIVPPVLLDGNKPAPVEMVGITATHHTTIAGPPLGQNIEYAFAMLCGIAESIVA